MERSVGVWGSAGVGVGRDISHRSVGEVKEDV